MPNASQSSQPASPEQILADLGLALPAPAAPVAAYVPVRRVPLGGGGALLFVSGQIPLKDGSLMATGRTPSEVPPDVATACARQCVLNALAAVKAEAGSLEKVRQIVRVGVWVASDPGFTDQPKVANGASELLQQVFGERGRHARAAVGAIALPLGAPVEVEMLVEVGS